MIENKLTTVFVLKKMFDIHDPIYASAAPGAKYVTAEMRLVAKKVFKNQGGDFNELISYAFYDFGPENQVYVQIHSTPERISNTLERRKLYVKFCSYVEACLGVFPFKPKVNTSYLVANCGSNEAKIVDLSQHYKSNPTNYVTGLMNPSKEILAEMALLDHECRPVRSQSFRKSNPKRKMKTNLVREAVRGIIPCSNSSCDEQSDTDKSNTSSDTEEGRKPRNKPRTKKSKHQGKAKTFKRKTQRGVRV